MALTKLTADLDNIQALSDKPNEIEGLTADQLKEKFDKGANDIKDYINDTLTAEVDTAYSGLFNFFYPVGTIYETTSTNLDTTTKMANHFGGTWEAYGTGRVIVAIDGTQTEFNTLGKTGGHKLLQSHNHTIKAQYPFVSGAAEWVIQPCNNNTPSQTSITAIANTGGGDSQNLQPYIVVYRYRRTA